MNDDEIFAKFTEVLRSLLGDDSIELGRNTVRADVPGWDSFNYINFIAVVEMQFGVRFRVADVESFRTVGDIATALRALLS